MSIKNWAVEPDEGLKKTIEVHDDLPVRAERPASAAVPPAPPAPSPPPAPPQPHPLDAIAHELTDELARAESGEAPTPETTSRELFLELLVLCLANLYAKTPLATQLFERSMLKAVIGHLPDTDAGRLSQRAEDWLRQEDMVRSAEGQKNYSLNRYAFAILSTPTASGEFGQLMERVLASYVSTPPSARLRLLTRRLGAHFVTRLGVH